MTSDAALARPPRRALIFDLDGTLIDNMPWHTRAWQALLAENGVTIDPERFVRETAGRTNARILGDYLGLSAGDVPRHAERKEALYRTLYGPHVRPVRGAEELLDEARRRGIATALATAAPMENVRFILDRTKLAPLFDTIVSADDGLPGKPAPDMFLTAVRRLGVAPEDAIVFEDAVLGLEAAESAGMRAVVLTTTLTATEVAGRVGVILTAPDFAALDLDALFARKTGPAT